MGFCFNLEVRFGRWWLIQRRTEVEIKRFTVTNNVDRL